MKIAITGIGIISAIGTNREETLSSLRAERTGIAAMQHLHSVHADLPVGEVPLSDTDLRQRLGIAPEEAIGRTSLLGISAAREALTQAAVDNVEDAAFLSGTTVGGMDTTERYWREWQRGERLDYVKCHEAGASTQAIADHIGPFACTMTPSTACSSALNAIMLGANMLRTGRVKRALAGGAECLSLFHLNGFRSLMILDHALCRPFDSTRAGLNLGEGAAYLVLEDEETAKARGAAILGYVAGYANTCDAYHQTASSPDGDGAYSAMQQALAMAGVAPEKVDYINAHGTGTPNNDRSESRAMVRLFGAEKMPPVSSTKSFTGHTTSASGAIEAAICVLCMQHGFVPANLRWQHSEEGVIAPVAHTMDTALHYVLCNSFGFGGNDSALLLSRYGHDLAVSTTACGIHRTPVVSGEGADYKAYIPPKDVRRMTRGIRQTLAGALQALAEQKTTPDAIVCATRYGCMANSMSFLQDMSDSYEQEAKPTWFMQSTHNTMASIVAIQTHNTGYNITHSNGAQSRADAVSDIRMQMELGMIRSALLVVFDEYVETWDKVLQQTGERSADISEIQLLTKEE